MICFGVITCKSTKELSFSGSFYSKNPYQLKKFIQKQLNQNESTASSLPSSTILIVPHAGYSYSGETAGKGYAAVQSMKPDVIVLVGPSHKTPTAISVYDEPGEASWRDPLDDGKTISIDPMAKILAQKLNTPGKNAKQIHEKEHSLEVQMPFLSHMFPKVPIIPILINEPQSSKRLIDNIVPLLKNKKVLYVISTDLSHYLPSLQAEEKDRDTLKHMASGSAEDFFRYLAQNENVACGAGALYFALLLQQALKLPGIQWKQYAQSEPMETAQEVVGYGSGLTTQPTFSLEKSQQTALLNLARNTLQTALKGTPLTPVENPNNLPRMGVFVTLWKNGQLRGCVGSAQAMYALPKAVAYYALQAAFHDGRFLPLTEKELKDIKIEISLLSTPQKVHSYLDIVPDKDGAILTKGEKQGIFLPEVWKDMSRPKFFQELCRQKAGLPIDCYNDPDVGLQNFQTFSFQD